VRRIDRFYPKGFWSSICENRACESISCAGLQPTIYRTRLQLLALCLLKDLAVCFWFDLCGLMVLELKWDLVVFSSGTFYFRTKIIWIVNQNFVLYSTSCYSTTMGVARGASGPWSPKYFISIFCPHFANFTKMSYNGRVNIMTSSKRKQRSFAPQSFLANLLPATSLQYCLHLYSLAFYHGLLCGTIFFYNIGTILSRCVPRAFWGLHLWIASRRDLLKARTGF